MEESLRRDRFRRSKNCLKGVPKGSDPTPARLMGETWFKLNRTRKNVKRGEKKKGGWGAVLGSVEKKEVFLLQRSGLSSVLASKMRSTSGRQADGDYWKHNCLDRKGTSRGRKARKKRIRRKREASPAGQPGSARRDSELLSDWEM